MAGKDADPEAVLGDRHRVRVSGDGTMVGLWRL
jgi:hypothetical protein